MLFVSAVPPFSRPSTTISVPLPSIIRDPNILQLPNRIVRAQQPGKAVEAIRVPLAPVLAQPLARPVVLAPLEERELVLERATGGDEVVEGDGVAAGLGENVIGQ